MRYRQFGRTGLSVSEVGFGSWAIGGTSFGNVARPDALRALAIAEELGCNFVDTAAVYGASETILGEFLRSRREKWVVASKYSGQRQGMTATLEEQLDRLGVERIDFYQIHWAPRASEAALYEELERLKESGKVRFTGLSLYTAADISWLLEHTSVDGFQVAFSLLDPRPLLPSLEAVRQSGRAVVVRSALKEGFLAGSHTTASAFPDPNDQRHAWSRRKIVETAMAAARFRFLEQEAGSMLAGAVSYPLSFPEISTVILSTKNEKQARTNFGEHARHQLSVGALARIEDVQASLGLLSDGLSGRIRRAAHRVGALMRHE